MSRPAQNLSALYLMLKERILGLYNGVDCKKTSSVKKRFEINIDSMLINHWFSNIIRYANYDKIRIVEELTKHFVAEHGTWCYDKDDVVQNYIRFASHFRLIVSD